MSNKEEILIIGSGLMSLAFLSGLYTSVSTRFNITVCDGLRSTHISKYQLKKNELNLRNYETHSVTTQGLAKYWHSIIPSVHINESADARELFKRWYGAYPAVHSDLLNTYFVPYFPVRPNVSPFATKRITNDLVVKLKDNTAYFTSGLKIKFDKVIFCCGTIPALKILYASGLASQPCTLSDHLNVFLGVSTNAYQDKVTNRMHNGYIKKYDLIDGEMIIERPAFSKRLPQTNTRSSNIYANSTIDIIYQLLSRRGFTLIPEALHNKLGIFKRAPYTKYYMQILAKDLFHFTNNSLTINKNTEKVTLEKTLKIAKQLPVNLSNEHYKFMSGIHLSANITDTALPENYYLTGGVANKCNDSLHNSFRNATEAYELGKNIAQ